MFLYDKWGRTRHMISMTTLTEDDKVIIKIPKYAKIKWGVVDGL